MLPLYPPYAIADFALTRGKGRLPDGRPRQQADPDRLPGDPALEPDPVFIGLRRLATAGPIGVLTRWCGRQSAVTNERRDCHIDPVAIVSAEPPAITDFEQDDIRTKTAA